MGGFRRTCLLVPCVLLLGLGRTACAADLAADPRVSLSAHDEPLSTVVERLSQAAGCVVAAQRNVASRRVSLQLDQVPLTLALQLLAEVAGLEVSKVDQVYLLHRAETPPGGAFTPLVDQPGQRPVLDRERLVKKLLLCRNQPPSRLAATFGRRGVVGRPGGLTIVRAEAPPAPTSHTFLGHRTEAVAVRDRLLDEAQVRFQKRWSEPSTATDEQGHPLQSPLAVPEGITAVIGFDPSSRLIVVGDEAAVDTFVALAEELDTPAGRLRLNATAFVLPAEQVEQLAFEWTPTAVAQGATARLAVSGSEAAEQILTAAAGNNRFALEPLVVDNATPASFGLSLGFSFAGAIDDCTGLPVTAVPQVDWLVATCDLKVVPWRTAGGGVSLAVTPALGEVLMELTNGAAEGRAALNTTVPGVAARARLAAGHSLVLAGVDPVGDYRAADACPLLAHLPLVGEIYRPAEVPANPLRVVVLLSAEPLE